MAATADATPDCTTAAYRQQYGSKTVQNAASRGERHATCGGDGDRVGGDSQVLAMASLRSNPQDAAERDEKGERKRRRPDSNRGWRICNPLP
jgi:hypothetical protein